MNEYNNEHNDSSSEIKGSEELNNEIFEPIQENITEETDKPVINSFEPTDNNQQENITDYYQPKQIVPEYNGQYQPPHVAQINNYQPVEFTPVKPKSSVATGVKVFALLMVGVILVTCSCLVGYLFGLNKYPNSSNLHTDTTLNLEGKPADTNEYTAAKVYDILNKSVVGITVYGNSGAGSTASGVIYTEDGYIITNDHIYSSVTDAKFIVKTYDGKEYSAEFVAGDARSDLAVLKINANGFIPAVFGNDKELVIGENVVAIGRPNSVEENSITEGIISLKERRVSTTTNYSMKMLQTSTPINPGNSGGALVNMYGQVVGITSSKISGEDYEGIGFAIPSTTTKTIVESLIKNGYVENRARLGVSYKAVTTVIKETGNYPSTGLIIASVDEESDLFGKVNVGDMITIVNGTDITSDSVILDIIEASKPGDTLTFTVYTAAGSYKTVTGKLLPDTGSSSYVQTIRR